ncbi:DEAD/DEAH box helicase family protein [Mycoplasma procyoni]|uniref:DEAD/DEAH box helicase family protein n=1 Tax=Mycoplasma procyoni TaxID=568784 RepID=UPI00280B97DA|nr:DEAD/DEAH box helicase family protein [Mycoplasma procyoni]
MKLIKSQELVVDQLVEKTKVSLDQNTKTSVYFKAPTGSGKTFMMINYIDKLIDHSKYDQSQKLIFVIVTLSSAQLPQQMEENFKEYKHYINNKDLQIHRIESPSNTKTSSKIEKNFKFYAEQNHVYIMGGASFKANSILREEEAIESFLSEIKHKNYKLIYIRDEAHIGSDVEKTASKGKNEIASFEKKHANKCSLCTQNDSYTKQW